MARLKASMARSPKFVPPVGMEGMSLIGVSACGCITAALSVTGPPGCEDWAYATEKDVREFYADMAKSGRAIEWMAPDLVRQTGIGCKCKAKAAA